MLMLEGNEPLTRDELARIPTPPATRTHQPVGHADVANAVMEIAHRRGFKPIEEHWMIQGGALYPEPGIRVPLHGARMFGTVDFEPDAELLRQVGVPALPETLVPSIGIRNSHDKSFSLSVLCGARVVVCANGMMVGEYHIRRKHTSGINLFEQIEMAMDAFVRCTGAIVNQVRELSLAALDERHANHLVVEAAREGAFSSSQILDIVRGYQEPQHEEFQPRNRWSLYNACTEVMKKQSPARQSDGFRSLNRVLLPIAA